MANGERVRIRSALGRTLYERLARDNELKEMDKSQWYQVDVGRLSAQHARLFVPMEFDADTGAFVENCHRKADWMFTQLWHSLVKAVLALFMTQTSINGWLRRGSMHVFSRAQLLRLLAVTPDWRAPRLLDLGAGDGAVTALMADHFQQVYVTEVSTVMTGILKDRGYSVLSPDGWAGLEGGYDVISCLNLLDRCDRPLTVLRQLRAALKPSGRVLVALVLPVNPYVEQSEKGDHTPVEAMDISGSTFTEQVSSVIDGVLIPAGFQVERWTRLPYLCEGDLEQAFYWLSDAVFVLRRADSTRPDSTATGTEPARTTVAEEVAPTLSAAAEPPCPAAAALQRHAPAAQVAPPDFSCPAQAAPPDFSCPAQAAPPDFSCPAQAAPPDFSCPAQAAPPDFSCPAQAAPPDFSCLAPSVTG